MTEEQNFEDLISAVQKLDTEERDVLQESTTRVINRVYEKICATLDSHHRAVLLPSPRNKTSPWNLDRML